MSKSEIVSVTIGFLFSIYAGYALWCNMVPVIIGTMIGSVIMCIYWTWRRIRIRKKLVQLWKKEIICALRKKLNEKS